MIRSREKRIHLDTSFLIRALVRGTPESVQLRRWLADRRSVAVSALVWAEFLCGPLTEADEARAGRVARAPVPFGSAEATEAARLFNYSGRRRGSFTDCMIGATALVDGAALATSNPGDFDQFIDAGLDVVGASEG